MSHAIQVIPYTAEDAWHAYAEHMKLALHNRALVTNDSYNAAAEKLRDRFRRLYLEEME